MCFLWSHLYCRSSTCFWIPSLWDPGKNFIAPFAFVTGTKGVQQFTVLPAKRMYSMFPNQYAFITSHQRNCGKVMLLLMFVSSQGFCLPRGGGDLPRNGRVYFQRDVYFQKGICLERGSASRADLPSLLNSSGCHCSLVSFFLKDVESEKNLSHLVRMRPSCLAQAQCWATHQPGAPRPGARPPREESSPAASASCCKTQR